MKKYNQTISVEINVDNVSEMLYNCINESFPHRELLVEAIIGSAIRTKNIGFIYNAFQGIDVEMPFTVGEEIICNEVIFDYKNKDENGVPISTFREIGEARICDIEKYSHLPIQVEYYTYTSTGNKTKDRMWVTSNKCIDLTESDDKYKLLF